MTKNVPKERILLTYEARGKGHQQNIGWNYKIDFVYSDDFFKTKKVGAHKGNKFLLTNKFLFIAQVVDQADQEVMLLVANSNDNTYNFQPIELNSNNYSHFKEHSYTFLDTSEKQVFVHVNHFGDNSKHGHIYISDQTGMMYSISLLNNVRFSEGQCDFEKINGLEGIYIANSINNDWMKSVRQGLVEAESELQTNMSNGVKNLKSSITLTDEFKDFIETYITFNKGGKWHRIPAPERGIDGSKYQCGDEGSSGTQQCYLNLHGISSSHSPPFYSVESAAGIIIANGNVGKYLNSNEEVSTYLSRDGGFTWKEVRKGSHNYEIGDHGGIIVMAEDSALTNTILYSWDEGQTWNDLKISKNKMTIRNIIIEPNNTSLRFLAYGQIQTKKGDTQGVVVSIDFSSLHKPQCRSPNDPNTSYSDYETWTPNDGRLGHSCLLGKKYLYIRRKSEVECFNGEELEKRAILEKCQCTEDDFECDVGYVRKNIGDQCTSVGASDSTDAITTTKPPEHCNGYYTVTKGYRRIPGDECIGGVDYDPLIVPCPFEKIFSILGGTLILVLIGIISALLYYSGLCDKFLNNDIVGDNYKRPVRNPIYIEVIILLINS